MRIAIFSDIHGKLLLPFKLVELYQKETGKNIDLILQCGDIGAYPDLTKLDKATIKHAKEDKDELGFHYDFTKDNQEIREFLEQLNLNMICVRGNHEDHDYLDELENQSDEAMFPIDVYKRVWVCKTGHIQEFAKENEHIKFVGVGRIGDRKGRTYKRYIQDYERQKIKELLKTKENFDILVTHDKDGSGLEDYGMVEIRKLLDNVLFEYHFYGHTGEEYKNELDDNSITRSIKVKELEFEDSGILPKGCMLILEKDRNEAFNLEIVSQNITNRLQKYNWRY